MPKSRKRDAEFLALQRRWYRRIKKDGFKDIEVLQSNGEFFPLLSGARFSNEKEEFYAIASWFSHEFEFKTKTEANIWALFCEGQTYRQIASRLKKKLYQVFKTINAIKNGPFEEYKRKYLSNL
jgi:hypothetical protein